MIGNERDKARERDRLKVSVEFLLAIPASRLTVGQIREIDRVAVACEKDTLPDDDLVRWADQAEMLARKEKGKLWLALYAS